MKPLIGKKESWGVSCDEIGFNYINEGFIPCINGFRSKILGLTLPAIPLFCVDDLKIAVTNPYENTKYDYLIIFGNLRTMAADLELIRRSKKPVIAICDFDFLDDVERYIAAGAQVIVFNKLRKYNG